MARREERGFFFYYPVDGEKKPRPKAGQTAGARAINAGLAARRREREQPGFSDLTGHRRGCQPHSNIA